VQQSAVDFQDSRYQETVILVK